MAVLCASGPMGIIWLWLSVCLWWHGYEYDSDDVYPILPYAYHMIQASFVYGCPCAYDAMIMRCVFYHMLMVIRYYMVANAGNMRVNWSLWCSLRTLYDVEGYRMIYISCWYYRHSVYGAMVTAMIWMMRILSYAYGPCAIVVPCVWVIIVLMMTWLWDACPIICLCLSDDIWWQTLGICVPSGPSGVRCVSYTMFKVLLWFTHPMCMVVIMLVVPWWWLWLWLCVDFPMIMAPVL